MFSGRFSVARNGIHSRKEMLEPFDDRGWKRWQVEVAGIGPQVVEIAGAG